MEFNEIPPNLFPADKGAVRRAGQRNVRYILGAAEVGVAEVGAAEFGIAEVGADSDRYTDKELKASTEYVYTVVPLRGKKEAREYGSFNVLGVSAVTGGK